MEYFFIINLVYIIFVLLQNCSVYVFEMMMWYRETVMYFWDVRKQPGSTFMPGPILLVAVKDVHYHHDKALKKRKKSPLLVML